MNFNAIENLGTQRQIALTKKDSPEALRQAAVQFEAVLLMQLTSALNGSGEADEDSLFGSDGGSDLAKKMFSEQMATTIANSGGIGLADTILRQFGAKNQPTAPNTIGSLANVIAAVKDIKGNNSSLNPINSKNISPLDNSKTNSISSETFTGDPNDLQVVSTFADEIIRQDGADGLKPFMYNGELLNSTRPRIVPNAALTDKNLPTFPSKNFVATNEINWQMPISGRLSSNFGMRFHPIDRKMKFHTGIDIAAPKGTPIKVAADGIVKFAGRKDGYGNVVVVAHADGTETVYAHASEIFVKEGQTVGGGTIVAAVGSTGKSTGPHLHFEVLQNGERIDPKRFLAKVLPKIADK